MAVPAGPSRRSVLGLSAVGLAGGGLGGPAAGVAGREWWRSRHVRFPLLSETVAVTGADTRTVLTPGSTLELLPGSRVAARARGAGALAAAEQSWLAAGADWTRSSGRWTGLLRSALLDLRSLTLPGGVALAGWSPPWRYLWPRDASFVAAALSAAGHPGDAVQILQLLQRLQGADGWFAARYRADGSADARPRQLDGTGWVVWALHEVVRGLAGTEARGVVERLAPMVTRSVDLVLRETAGPSGLPPASPDYWEVPETSVTLGTAAPLLAGLSAAAGLLSGVGEQARARTAAAGADRLAAAVRVSFGPGGYPRHVGGRTGDAAVTFLLPPFAATADADVAAAARTRAAQLRRPAGGMAPGVGWRHDGSSWTPETALFALSAAASGDTARASALLDWLETHRTARGSLPEMVRYDGRPASVAPLVWTAALVVLALAHLG